MSVHRNYWFGGERPVEGATVYVKPPAPDVPELVAAMTGPVTGVMCDPRAATSGNASQAFQTGATTWTR